MLCRVNNQWLYNMIDVKYNAYNNLINIKIGLMDSLYICLIFSNTNIFTKIYIFLESNVHFQ